MTFLEPINDLRLLGKELTGHLDREGLPQSGSLSLKQGLGFAWEKEKIHREIKLLSGNCLEINKPY